MRIPYRLRPVSDGSVSKGRGKSGVIKKMENFLYSCLGRREKDDWNQEHKAFEMDQQIQRILASDLYAG